LTDNADDLLIAYSLTASVTGTGHYVHMGDAGRGLSRSQPGSRATLKIVGCRSGSLKITELIFGCHQLDFLEDMGQIGETRDLARKSGCGCGCKGGTKNWDASVSSSPEFVRELDAEVDRLMQSARELKSQRGRLYYALPFLG